MREHRLGIAFALVVVICGWSARAHAAATVTPGSITAPATDVNVESAPSPAVTLSRNNTSGNPNYDLVVTTSCSGAGAGVFTLSAVEVALDTPKMVTVTYRPTQLGPRTCTVHVNPKNSTTPDVTFSVTGNGQEPPILTVGAVSNFGAVRAFDNAVAQHTSTRTITVTNDGDRQLQITNVTFTGDFSLDASSSTGTSVNIAGGGSRQWTILFNPSAVGNRTGSINFASNAGPGTSALAGDGTSGAITTSIQTLPTLQPGEFGTVAGGSIASLDVTLTHTGTVPKGTVTYTRSVTPADPAKAWFSIGGGTTIGGSGGTNAVTCAPPMNSTDTATATVTISADVDGSAGPSFTTNYTHQVSCTAGASLLALAPQASLDFGNFLLGVTTASQVLTLTNNGNQPTSVSISSTSANKNFFNLGTPNQCGLGGNPACMIDPGANIMISAQFSPTTEQTVTAGYTIASTGPSLGFTLTGRGVDRHLQITETMIQAPDTFKHPGDRATILDVPLINAGEYPVEVSELAIDNPEIWSIEEPTPPFMIGGLTTVNVKVRFAPVMEGKAMGQLIIVNDDPKLSRPTVLLNGNGKLRNVDMSPGTIDVGDTFAGIEARLSVVKPAEMLKVVNAEEADPVAMLTDFRIKDVLITGENATFFEVVERDSNASLANRELKAGEEVLVDVIFKPTYPGDFEATLTLLLDDDPDGQPPVTVRGRALYVDAHGSGGFGCSTGQGSRGAMLLIIGAVALLLRRRRR